LPPLLVLFAAVNLVIGTGAFSITGILGDIASGLGVGVAAAGQAMSVYALATALLAPLAMVLSGRWRRKSALLLALGLFTAGMALTALATSLPALLAGRVVMGVGAMFTPLAAGITITLVAPERRGQALALVFLGMSLSYVIGVPLASAIGAAAGWRAALWVTTGLGLLAFLAVALWVPRATQSPSVSFAGLVDVLRRPELLVVLALTLAYFSAIFAVFSYIGPVLRALVPMSAPELSLTLSLFGVAGMAGTLIGGWANDRLGARRTLWAQLLLLGAMMLALPFTAGHWPLMMVVMVLWGAAGFGMMAPQQSRLATMAPRETPLLLSLNTSMLYLGTALGAVLGGAAVATVGFERLPWVGALAVVVSLALLAASRALEARAAARSPLAIPPAARS
jgi:MFS transporter, DHA1 family, inner membrane transport protein